MHELSLAQNLIEQLLQLGREHKAKSITKVTVIIGAYSGVVADSFDFGFNVLKKESELTKNAELVLKTPPARFNCLDCNNSFPLAQTENKQQDIATRMKKCSSCGSSNLVPQGGSELILQQLEME